MAGVLRTLFTGFVVGAIVAVSRRPNDHTHPKHDDVKLTANQLRKLHAKIDNDHDGKVSIDEMKRHFVDVAAFVSHEDSLEHLSLFDADDDSHLTLDEHMSHIANETRIPELGMELADAMSTLDENHDGRLSWWEFFHLQPPATGDAAPSENSDVKVDEEGQARFDKFDDDEDGYLTPQELVHDDTQDQVDNFRAADKDGNGKLEHTEVMSMLYPATDAAMLRVIVRRSIANQDANSDGKISKDEWLEVGEDEVDEIFAALDTNGDGLLDEDELAHWESGHFDAEDSFRDALTIADKDQDSQITADELAMAAEELANSFVMPYLSHWHEHHEL